MRLRTGIALAVAGCGVATTAYAIGYERTHWTLRRFDVPILPPGAEPLRLLHLSDIHMTPNQTGKKRWIRSLAALEPHLVAVTGDNLAHPGANQAVIDGLAPLLALPGAFVFGSNDYYGPVPKNPLRYLNPRHKRVTGAPLPWQGLRAAFLAHGWHDLTNANTELKVAGHRIEIRGVDDPHLRRDRYEDVAGPADPAALFSLGLVHAPEPRVLDRFAGDNFDLLLCGHTHGGQLRVPFYGALVTNCSIDRARCRWLSRYADRTWLHVSAGLGTSPYYPFRFACPPEATLLTLVAAEHAG